MRFALLATASTLLVGLATFACSGSATDETGTADAGTTVADSTSTTSGTSSATTTGTTASVDASTVDATVTAIATADAGAACAADSIHETESNDTTANVIAATGSSSFCGRLSGTDIDKVSFMMPTTIASFEAGFDRLIGLGLLDVVADVDGQQFDFFGRWPFVAGGTYTFTLTGTILPGAELDYRLNFQFKP